MPKNDSLTFSQLFDRLEKISEELEQDDLDLDAGIAKFEEGLRYAQELKKRLRTAEQKIEILKKKFDGDDEENEE